MIGGLSIALISFAYLFALFAVAWFGDRRADQGRSVIANPTVYVLSLAVYHTSWTFYGSVGLAAQKGLSFLPIYLGPTLTATLFWIILGRMVRIGKVNRITSIADFIAARYGKSPIVAGLVTVIAVVGIMPYISLQLKAVSTTFTVLSDWPGGGPSALGWAGDTTFLVACVLAAFAVLFGTRHIDAAEHHEGMVLAIAFESVVKLAAFVAVGLFVTFGLFSGFTDIFAQAAERADLKKLLVLPDAASLGEWVALLFLSMLVILCLPRQFQVSVVADVDERHVRRATWMLPAYMFVINLFVLPIALAGRLLLDGTGIGSDLYVLALPLSNGAHGLAIFAFLGGLSAAASMVIVETIALATMVCNDLVMPVLLRLSWLNLSQRPDLSRWLLAIRRGTILAVVLLGYAYVLLIGDSYALVTIGLVSFCAAAQFAPALLGGILWKGATEKGAIAGLSAGFLIWIYTLLLPSFAKSGWIVTSFIDVGPLGLDFLNPYSLFGLKGLSPVSHSLVWSMLVNLGAFVAVSLMTNQTALERIQAAQFVDPFHQEMGRQKSRFWRGTAGFQELQSLAIRFVGRERAERAFGTWARERGLHPSSATEAGPDLVAFAERLLAGAIGTASARVMVASVAKGEVVSLDEVMEILDEASQIIAYSQKLEAATSELKAANERLKELDRLKDDFLSTVTHELRTPLTSIRSFSEILFDNPQLDPDQRQQFLGIIIKESERLTRLINQVLDFAKMESGRMQWNLTQADPRTIVQDAAAATRGLFDEKNVQLDMDLDQTTPTMITDTDKLMQVVINLLSNAVKFVEPDKGRVILALSASSSGIQITVADNGPGIPVWARAMVFEKFRQVGDTMTNKPQGTGLGLAISKTIVEHLGGRIWVGGEAGQGAVFGFFLPLAPPDHLPE